MQKPVARRGLAACLPASPGPLACFPAPAAAAEPSCWWRRQVTRENFLGRLSPAKACSEAWRAPRLARPWHGHAASASRPPAAPRPLLPPLHGTAREGGCSALAPAPGPPPSAARPGRRGSGRSREGARGRLRSPGGRGRGRGAAAPASPAPAPAAAPPRQAGWRAPCTRALFGVGAARRRLLPACLPRLLPPRGGRPDGACAHHGLPGRPSQPASRQPGERGAASAGRQAEAGRRWRWRRRAGCPQLSKRRCAWPGAGRSRCCRRRRSSRACLSAGR